MIRSRPSSGPDIDRAYAAAQCVVKTHQRLVELVKAGMTLAQVDMLVAKTLADLDCRSCFIGYAPRGMPRFPSHACLSLNECVVHGTATYLTRPLQRGDLLKIDIGVKHKDWIGDAGWTYAIQEASPLATRLMTAGKESLARGVTRLRPGAPLADWAAEVSTCVEREHKLFLVRGLGGHGYGQKLHEGPFVSNVPASHDNDWPESSMRCVTGMLLAVEPMLAAGTGQIVSEPRTWPIYTADGSLSVHYEHDVLVTETGPRILTEGMQSLPDIID